MQTMSNNENKCEDCAGCSVWKCDCSNIRNQALEEFYEKLKQKEETSEDYTKWVSMKNIKIVFDELMKEIKDKENKKELSNFINGKMQKQEDKISLPNEMYRYMFDNSNKAVPVECKVGKILRDGFTLIHFDKREWKFLYSDIGKHVWYTEKECKRYIEETGLNK